MDRLLARLGTLGREAGAGIVEYALVLALIAVVSISSISLLGRRTFNDYECTAAEIEQPGLRKAVTDKISSGSALDSIEKRFADVCI